MSRTISKSPADNVEIYKKVSSTFYYLRGKVLPGIEFPSFFRLGNTDYEERRFVKEKDDVLRNRLRY